MRGFIGWDGDPEVQYPHGCIKTNRTICGQQRTLGGGRSPAPKLLIGKIQGRSRAFYCLNLWAELQGCGSHNQAEAKGSDTRFAFVFLLNDDSIFYSELDELSICFYAMNLHHAIFVKCHCPRSDSQDIRDVLHGLTFDQKLHDLSLSRCESFLRPYAPRVLDKTLLHAASNLRSYVFFALECVSYGSE